MFGSAVRRGLLQVGKESKVRTVDDDPEPIFAFDENDKTVMKHIWVAQRSSKTEPRNFTKISRTGLVTSCNYPLMFSDGLEERVFCR